MTLFRERVVAGVVLLCFVAGLHFYGVGYNPIFLLAALLPPLFGLLLLSPFTHRLDKRFVSACVLTLVAIAISHVFMSVSPDSSFMPSIVLATLPMWAMSAASFRRPTILITGLIGVVGLFATLSVVEFLFSGQRAHAPLWDPNSYASLLYLAWFALLGLFFCSGNVSVLRISAAGASSMVFALALLATESRFAIAVVVLVVAICGIAALRLQVPKAVALVVALASIMALALFGLGNDGAASAGNSALQSVGASQSESHRWEMYVATWEAIKAHGGLMGTGVYTFSLLYPLHRSVTEQTTSALFVHNDLVQFALEGGVWIVLPALLFFAWVGVATIRAVVMAKTWDHRTGLLIGLAVAILHSLVNYVFYVLPIVMMIGVYVGTCFVRDQSSSETDAIDSSWKTTARFLSVGLLIVNMGYLVLDSLTYGVFSKQLHMPGAVAIRSDPEQMLNYARIAQSLNSRRGIPVLGEARLLEVGVGPESDRTTQAIMAAYERAIQVDPWNPLTYTSYSAFLERLPDPENVFEKKQLSLVLAAHRLDPANTNTNAVLLQLYLEQRNGSALIEQARDIVRWCERIRRTGGQQADELLYDVSKVIELANVTDLEPALTDCQKKRISVQSDSRSPPWFMQWLREFGQESESVRTSGL